MKKSRGRGIILSYGFIFCNMICGLFLSSFLLRQLGDTEYGLYQTISAFATYLVMLEFGTGTVMCRNIAVCRNSEDKDRLKNNISTIWYLTVFLSLVIVAVSAVFYINIGNIYANTMTAGQIASGKNVFIVITAFLVFSFYTQTANGILMGFEDYTFSQVMKLVKLISRTALLVALILFKPYAILIALVDAGIGLIVLVVTLIHCIKNYGVRFRLRDFDKKILWDSAPLCLALVIQSFVNQANNSVDKFLIGIMMSIESVAVYSVAQYIYQVFSSVTTTPISMYLPKVAKDITSGYEGKQLTDSLVQPCRLVVLLGGMIVGGFFAVGKQFIMLVYGTDKQEAWLYALIIMIPMFINMSNGILINVLDVLKKRLMRSCVLFFTTVLNIVLSILLMKAWGMIGAVIATAVSTFIGQILVMNIYYAKKINIKVMYLFGRIYSGILPIIIIASVASYFVAKFISNNTLSMLTGGALFLFVTLICCMIFGFNDYEKNLVKRLLKIKK
ncbi:MAG: oligosaccharide flippase family protein [Clostridia bacterium]|nr:oligosaccharide flippase family protein [Clostridia bacterium]